MGAGIASRKSGSSPCSVHFVDRKGIMHVENTWLDLVWVSEWIDEANKHKPAELQLWERCGKVGEEFGEVIEALIGLMGQNPRKGVTHSLADVKYELLDVAATALGAYEHIGGNKGEALLDFLGHIQHIRVRAQRAQDSVRKESLQG